MTREHGTEEDEKRCMTFISKFTNQNQTSKEFVGFVRKKGKQEKENRERKKGISSKNYTSTKHRENNIAII